MIFREPLLVLKRLVVIHHDGPVYDQNFHDGVNIIRGSNSSGKSTILDCIFFVMGGDFTSWKPEAESCQAVVAEVEINGSVTILRRYISIAKYQPMDIYWGNFEEAMSSPIEGWERHPFKRTDGKESFSQVLFKALKMPEVRNENTSNITMHQILRLICVDQMSNVNSILRDEQWDSSITRKTVGDLLYGLYNDQLYADELRLRDTQKELDRSKSEHDSLQNVLIETDQALDLSAIEKHTTDIQDQLILVKAAIADSQGGYATPDSPEDSELIGQLELKLKATKSEYGALSRQKETLDLEIEDSKSFIESLDKRLSSLDDSLAAEKALGRLTLQVCPECLQAVDDKHEEGHCFLCKQPTNGGFQKHTARMRNELTTQIHESKGILKKKSEALVKESSAFETKHVELRRLEDEFDKLVSRIRSRRDAHLDELLEKKGVLEGGLRLWESYKKLALKLQESHAKVGQLQIQVDQLNHNIKIAVQAQAEKREKAEGEVETFTKEFLHRDLAREDLFALAHHVTVDFERNLCLVDRRSSFSASSISYLKAAVHFSILFASLELDFFRYPKLVVNDNIEDKGMEEARSQNLQAIVVDLSKRSKVRHQIILATSMINPNLDSSEICVGPAYTKENKTLSLKSLLNQAPAS